MTNLKVENVYTRQTAKELTHKHFWKLLGMFAIVFGINYAVSLGGTALLAGTGDETTYMVGYLITLLITTLLSGGLTLGLLSAMINLCRGNAVRVGAVFGRMSQCLKGFGLSLWVGLKTVLWMLPGYALLIAGVIMTSGMSNTANAEESAAIVSLLMLGAMILIFALVIPAAMRYMLSTFVMADKPDTGVFESVRQSKAMMKGHKWQAFKLIIPVLLVMYVILLVAALVLGAGASLLGITPNTVNDLSVVLAVVMTAVMAYYMIRMYVCYTLFYIKRAEEQNPVTEAAAE